MNIANLMHSVDDIPLMIFNLTKLSTVLKDVIHSAKVRKSITGDYSFKQEKLDKTIQCLKDKIEIK